MSPCTWKSPDALGHSRNIQQGATTTRASIPENAADCNGHGPAATGTPSACMGKTADLPGARATSAVAGLAGLSPNGKLGNLAEQALPSALLKPWAIEPYRVPEQWCEKASGYGRFQGKSCPLPGRKATQQGLDVVKAAGDKGLCHTGTLLLLASGTV